MDIIMIGLLLIAIVLLILLLLRKPQQTETGGINTAQLQMQMQEQVQAMRKQLIPELQQSMQTLGQMLAEHQQQVGTYQAEKIKSMERNVAMQLQQFEQRLQSLDKGLEQRQENLRTAVQQQIQQMEVTQKTGTDTMQKQVQQSMQTMQTQMQEAQAKTGAYQIDAMQTMQQNLRMQLAQFEARLKTLESTSSQNMEQMRSAMVQQLQGMQGQQETSLDKIRGMVEEKLTQTLEDSLSRSFQRVSKQLEDVYKGLGEMQTLATGVGDLKKVLSNVKTRGILGEIQLGAILQEILTPEQYDTEVPTIPGSRERVEFAVKLPGDDTHTVYLPIDSKFPGETYAALQDAYETGDAEQVSAARKVLVRVITGCAKDIHDKYVEPPYTTNFAILFLPFEGLYAEVVNSGLVETLQRTYQVNIAGPSTMAAMLNALQMGFRTLAIQKRSSEVWTVLGAVKTEFDKFGDVLAKAQKSLQGAEKHLEMLMGTRTNAIHRKLRDVERLDPEQAGAVLELPVLPNDDTP